MLDPASTPPVVQFVEHFLGAFAAIFPMVNPFSTMTLFLSLTSGMSASKQRYQALKASIIAAVTLPLSFQEAFVSVAIGLGLLGLTHPLHRSFRWALQGSPQEYRACTLKSTVLN